MVTGMPKRIDLTNRKFGNLTVLSVGKYERRNLNWIVRCICGNTKEIQARSLLGGRTISCGCVSIPKDYAHTHRMTRTRTYKSWSMMKSRCLNENYTHYKYYGGRGIKVCDRWIHSFEAFLTDMGEAPEGFTLDRIDPNKDYSPGNCRWASRAEQVRNRRNTVLLSMGGKSVTLIDLAAQAGVTRSAIYGLLYRKGLVPSSVPVAVDDILNWRGA